MDRRNLGIALIVGGGLLVALSLILLLSRDTQPPESATSPATTAVPPPPSQPTSTTSTSTTTTAPPTTTTTLAVSTTAKVAAFIGRFAEAIDSQDAGFLFGSLHPEIINGYGENECRVWIETRVMALSDYFATSTPRGPSTGTLVTPGGSIEFDNRYTVTVSFTFDGETVADTADFVAEEGQIFFTGPCDT